MLGVGGLAARTTADDAEVAEDRGEPVAGGDRDHGQREGRTVPGPRVDPHRRRRGPDAGRRVELRRLVRAGDRRPTPGRTRGIGPRDRHGCRGWHLRGGPDELADAALADVAGLVVEVLDADSDRSPRASP